MVRLIVVLLFVMVAGTVSAQNFPDAQKQPRQKEMRSQHRKFRRAAHRRHIRRGTSNNYSVQPELFAINYFDNRKTLKVA